MKLDLLRRTEELLAQHGYAVEQLHGSFDLLAKRNGQFLTIKILNDANALNAAHAADMTRFAAAIGAAPLVISEKAGGTMVDVVAIRHGLFTLNLPTLQTALNKPLFFFRTAAGMGAKVNPQQLQSARTEAGISLNALAHHLGISRTMVAQYEAAAAHVIARRAAAMAQLFGQRVLQPLDIFAAPHPLAQRPTSSVTEKYLSLGFSAVETHRLPFDIVAKQTEEIILTEIGDRAAKRLFPLAELLEADSLVVFDKHKPKDIPALRRDEFLELSGAGELIKFVKTY